MQPLLLVALSLRYAQGIKALAWFRNYAQLVAASDRGQVRDMNLALALGEANN